MKNDKTDFTQGSIPKKLALFMLPILGHWCCRPLTAR